MKVENELPSAKSVEMFLVRNGTFDPRNMNFPFNCKIQRKILRANFPEIIFRQEIYQGQSFFGSSIFQGTKNPCKQIERNEPNRAKKQHTGATSVVNAA